MSSKLVDHLRALPDDGLGALLQLRPDLVVPVPADLSALAGRVQGRASVARVLDALDQFTLEILDGLRLVRDDLGVVSVDRLLTMAAEAGVEPARVRVAIDRLRARFVVFGTEPALHLVHAVDELLPPYPAGLGRPAEMLDAAAGELVADAAGLRRVLLSAPPDARAVLDRLAGGPPIGTVQPASLRAGGPDSPVRWLVEHRLLVRIADEAVELPREVAILLRRDHGPLGELHPDPPPAATQVRTGVDSAGAGQTLEAVRHVDALLHELAAAPAVMLRSFGLGVRDLRRLTRDTGLTEPVTVLLLEVAYAAGLLTYTDPVGRGGDQQWLPSPAYDTWRAAPLSVRWAQLARTWLATTRTPAMVGHRDEKEKAIVALSYEAARLTAPMSRRAALDVLAAQPEGTSLGPDDVAAQLAWRRPRRMGRASGTLGPAALARASLVEAAALGVVALDAITSFGRVLLAEAERDRPEDPLGIHTRDDAVVIALEPLLPKPVDQVVVQADLTVVVPGPPEAGLAAELALVADTESRGGASVYRVTPASVRRALDSGYTAGDVHQLFARRSRTAVPQTLQYLIDDVARRHGGLRAGTAGAYLRSDDESLIAEVLADRALVPLGLRRLAPTVLMTSHATVRLLDSLRTAGYAPVAEDATGATVVSRPATPRAPARPAPKGARPDDFDPPRLHGPRLAGVVEQIRLGDRLARAARRTPVASPVTDADGVRLPPSQAHTQALAVLAQALRDKARVWVRFVDGQGGAAARLVRPVSISAGYLRAEDDRAETMHTFALHRITSAVAEDADE